MAIPSQNLVIFPLFGALCLLSFGIIGALPDRGTEEVGPNLPSGVADLWGPYLATLACFFLAFGLLHASAVCLTKARAERALQDLTLENEHLRKELGALYGAKSLKSVSVPSSPPGSLSGSLKGLPTSIVEGQNSAVGKQGRVSNEMFQDPTGSGEICCAGVPPLPSSPPQAPESSLVGLRGRLSASTRLLKIISHNDSVLGSATKTKEEEQPKSPWLRLSPPKLPSPTLHFACHTLLGMQVASPPCEAVKWQARLEGATQIRGESFLHSPTIYCFANRCETHFPSHETVPDPSEILSEEVSPQNCAKDPSSPHRPSWELSDSSEKVMLDAEGKRLAWPRYMVAEACSPSHEGEHAPVFPTTTSLSANCTSSGEIPETFPETVPMIEIYPQPQRHAEGSETHIRMFRAQPILPALPPAEGHLVPTSPEERRERFNFPALPPAEGQLVPSSPEGGRVSFTPEVVDSGDEEEEEHASLSSPASPPRNIYSVPQFPEEIMDIDLTHVYLLSPENVSPEVAQTRQAIAKIRTRLQSAFAQQKQITEVLEQWFVKIRSLATYTESIAETVRGQGDGLFKLRGMTHSALQDQNTEFSAKYEWLNSQLEELKSSLEATFKEVRRLIPDELPTKLHLLEDKLDNLQRQFHNLSQNPPPIPTMPEEVTTQFRQMDERLTVLQAQVDHLKAQPKVVVPPSVPQGPSFVALQNRVKHLEGLINEDEIGKRVVGMVQTGVKDLLTDHVIPQVERELTALPVLQGLQQWEDHLTSQLAELTRRLSQLEESSPQTREPPQQFEAVHTPPLGAQGPRGVHGVPSSSSSFLPPPVPSPSKGAKEKWARPPHVALPETLSYEGVARSQGFTPPPAPQGGPASGSVARTPWKKPSGQSLGPQALPAQEVASQPQARGAKKQPWRMGLEASQGVESGSRFGSEADRESTTWRSHLPDVAIQAVSQVACNILTPLIVTLRTCWPNRCNLIDTYPLRCPRLASRWSVLKNHKPRAAHA